MRKRINPRAAPSGVSSLTCPDLRTNPPTPGFLTDESRERVWLAHTLMSQTGVRGLALKGHGTFNARAVSQATNERRGRRERRRERD